ncbi:hypothetical protein GCM10007972_27830 [Iodidimonas muriae]|uniref:Pentapeptide MXKDX repeat protein n=1 Tax=Iodidimonas muriae TaxID=261467 RepID=A0ABQ2LH07_9PROT|nr:DUF4175 domain-containing protein [Iodidimonas muriae]GER08859.1 hypothetical protein JCM17843_31690 [Kordiimonadales bacterium JCM 17843]GGO17616.1 hypothetical protein GCM10007972_27830 [Iodidimonas muriae]
MKTTLRTLLLATALILPVSAYAGHHESGSDEHKMEKMQMCMQGEKCPMADQMGDMHSKMESMMSDMKDMTEHMKDPAMKEKMQKMHGDMGGMMEHMEQMHKNMGTMMGGKGNNPEHDEHKH